MMEIEPHCIQSRNYKCELGLLSRSDGSAILSQDGTIIVAAIYGPLEAKQQRMLIEKSLVEAHFRPKAGVPGVSDRLKESIIRNTCETVLLATLYPRTSISVVIQEIQNKGEVIGCAINAACLALLDSGIEMKYLVGAITCALDTKNTLVINPPHLVLEKATASFTFVFENLKSNTVASHTTGIFTETQYKSALTQSREASAAIFQFYKTVMVNKIRKTNND